VEDGVRQDMVATAVRFLENDRVRASTEDMKRKFLLKKGLNESEIREAFARVKPQQEISQRQTVVHSLQAGGQQPVLAVTQSSFSTRVRDLLNLLLLIGGASYGIRYLWKTYIAPWLFGPAKPAPNPQAAVVETCQAVLGGVQQLQQAITSLQTSISSQAEKLERAVENRQVIKTYFLTIYNLNRVKCESSKAYYTTAKFIYWVVFFTAPPKKTTSARPLGNFDT